MGAKAGAVLAVVVGWILAFGIFMFLRTFENTVILWLWFLVVIAFLPRETYKVYKLLTQKDPE